MHKPESVYDKPDVIGVNMGIDMSTMDIERDLQGAFAAAAARRRINRSSYGDDLLYSNRTRKRVKTSMKDDGPEPVVAAKREITVGNDNEVREYYAQQFRNLQQTACKLIAKAWVKQVEPKKQSVHPYTGADSKAPDWWPKPWGPTKDEKVRHKEPDHLYKRERVYLLCHILRLVVEPNEKQHPAIQQLNLNVQKLHDSALEALTGFFTDKDGNKNKKSHLDHLFTLARHEERFKRGEIDPHHKVYVMKADRTPIDTLIGDDVDTDSQTQILAIESIARPLQQKTLPTSIKTVASLAAGIRGSASNPISARTTELAVSGATLPVRGPQQYDSVEQPATLASTSHASPHPPSFIENGNGLTHITMPTPPAPQEPDRRTSLFQSPNYESNSASGIYPAWGGSTTSPVSSQPLYNFTQNSNSSHAVPYVTQSLQSTQAPYLATESLPRSYDPNQNNAMFGPGSFGQPHPNYVTYSAVNPTSAKADSSTRGNHMS